MSNLQTIAVPDIGDFKDVPVIELLVAPGDVVAVDDTLIVLESEKATLDVPSPGAGRVKEIKVRAGDRVSQGTAVLVLETAVEYSPSEPTAQAAVPTAPSGDAESRPSPMPETQVGTHTPECVRVAEPRVSTPRAAPSVRRVARELGVDLTEVSGSGPRGRISKEDVQRHVKARLSLEPKPSGTGLDLLPWPKVDFEKFGPLERVSLSKIRRISGANLTRNAIVIPHVTNFDEADITDLESFRLAINKEHDKDGLKLTILPFVIKATAVALKAYPDFNASLDGDELIRKRYYNIGVAADTPDGLVVPVIKDADKKGIIEIAEEARKLAADARAGKLKLGDLQGASFTISSLGGIGGTDFTPIINAPEVAILGMTRAQVKPVWDGKSFLPRLMQPVSLSWDHRAVDGVAAARFLVKLCQVLTEFRRTAL
jgi:pyruvate dehydrogenase E2 component (dihydrolipoamide acetyltransferase)